MQYGHFDNARREYVIDRVDLPASWTNYLGTEKMCAVVNHTAGGYLFCGSAEYHRITRFRANAVPMDRPGHYIYLRDDDTGEYWSVSWQPVGKPLDQAKYTCRHGMSYSVYECEYNGIFAAQTLFIPRGEDVEIWDLQFENCSGRPRHISVFSYAELSFHQIDMDNRNFQMSLYAAGSSYADGILEQDLFYEETGYQYFAASFQKPDSFDAVRESYIGPYRTESNPLGVEKGSLEDRTALGGNQCCGLHKRYAPAAGETVRCAFFLGEGRRAQGARIREKFSAPAARDAALAELRRFWDAKCAALQVHTPSGAMDTMLNIWTLYQSEINIMFSRFASFIEVGGRTGLGYRDTAQDAMTVLHSNPAKCRQRICQLLNGLVGEGYGLHLFEPEWFDKKKAAQSFKSPTVVPTPSAAEMIHGLKDACSDDALWLVFTVVQYAKETGDEAILYQVIPYADGGEGTVYEHLQRILDFSTRMVGAHGICQGLRADWNDCLNLGGGESAMVSFLHVWALGAFVELAAHLGRTEDAAHYRALRAEVAARCEKELWDGAWYLRGFTKSGRPIGTHTDAEGRVHLESNTWAVLSGAASPAHGAAAMDAVYENLFTPYGLMLNAPAYTKPDDEIGFVTRVYPGLKENGSIFSHPNPWAWAAECRLGRGDRAMELYNALCPALQNDKIEIRKSEPYSYCQFVSGRDHASYGEAHHPFMTGSGGWSYFAATQYILGIRPDFDHLIIDPCIPHTWGGFTAERTWRGAQYRITVENPAHICRGVAKILVNGVACPAVPAAKPGENVQVTVIMGKGAEQ
ncbi:MAG: N,N'-diacetylchitobiose phosphorylase [Faecalibacterium sp.]|jgi:N,N'-diacetylchitobiose phosphorylase|nr:N,N'-diacetylchitobiose phosphorylase [Faecalibacterium sp.]